MAQWACRTGENLRVSSCIGGEKHVSFAVSNATSNGICIYANKQPDHSIFWMVLIFGIIIITPRPPSFPFFRYRDSDLALSNTWLSTVAEVGPCLRCEAISGLWSWGFWRMRAVHSPCIIDIHGWGFDLLPSLCSNTFPNLKIPCPYVGHIPCINWKLGW